MEECTKREPIIGLRKPIVGLRVSIKLEDVAHPNMRWEIQYEKLNNYIKYVAAQVVSGLPSAMMSSEDLYQEGLILLYTCFEKYKLKPETDFQSLFKASLWRLLRGFCYKKKEIQTVDLDEVFDMGYTDTTIMDMYEEFRLQQVADLLGDNQNALNILKEIINPSERTLWEMQMDFERKCFIKSQNPGKNTSSEITIKPDILRRALNLTESEFSKAFKEVQSGVYSVYSVDVDIKSYQETDTMTDEEFSEIYSSLTDIVNKLKTA